MKEEILTGLERNRQVKDYICRYFCSDPDPMEYALKLSKEEGLKPIHVPQNVAKTISLIAKLVRPKKILEIGTLGGYSTLWLSQALEEGGKIITIENVKKHIAVAKKAFAYAGKQGSILIREGDAIKICTEMVDCKEGPFDVIFIDADKCQYPDYLDVILKLARSGTVILSDNLIPKRGEIGCPDPRDHEAVEIYTFNQILANHPNLETIPLTTIVGEKGGIDATGLTLVR